MNDWIKPNLLRSITNVLEFGKHKGKTIQQVMKEDPNWLHWALQTIKDFKLNRNALLLLPPQKPKDEDDGRYNDHYGDPIPGNWYDHGI